jgi:hypothetical protein
MSSEWSSIVSTLAEDDSSYGAHKIPHKMKGLGATLTFNLTPSRFRSPDPTPRIFATKQPDALSAEAPEHTVSIPGRLRKIPPGRPSRANQENLSPIVTPGGAFWCQAGL